MAKSKALVYAQRRELLCLLGDEAVYKVSQVTIRTVIPFGSSADEVQLRPVPQGGSNCLESQELKA